jgi:eukaryotic-like serine/threonine-protein kinase
MALTSGTKLGPYEIQSPLGAGGMGEVYRALDTRLDRTVAIKVLPSHLSSSPELKQRLEREAKAISSLQHPHICALYVIDTPAGRFERTVRSVFSPQFTRMFSANRPGISRSLTYGRQ